MTAVNNFDATHRLSRFVMGISGAERVARFRARRRRGYVLAAVRVDRNEIRKLVALGYLDAPVTAKGPTLDAAIEAYFSDKLIEEPDAL
jgi:hypothetical protein